MDLMSMLTAKAVEEKAKKEREESRKDCCKKRG